MSLSVPRSTPPAIGIPPQAPIAGNDYYVNNLTLRSPTNLTTIAPFAGDSLNISGSAAVFMLKTTNVITVTNLVLDNLATLQSSYNAGATSILSGGITIGSGGAFIYPGNQTLVSSATIAGSGQMIIQKPRQMILTGSNTFNGSLLLQGTSLILASNAWLTPSSLTMQSFLSTSTFTNSYVTNLVQPGGHMDIGTGPGSSLTVGSVTSTTQQTNCYATLDVSSQPLFTVNVGSMYVGINYTVVGPKATGTLLMATNNNVTATSIMVGDNSATGASGITNFVILGSGSNYLNTPTLTIGARREMAQMKLPAGGVVRLDYNGSSSDFSVGNASINTSQGPTTPDSVDFSPGTFIANLGNLVIGQKSGGNSGSISGIISLGTNSLNSISANAVTIGSLAGSTTGSPLASGTLTFAGGSFVVNNSLTLGSYDNSGFGTASGTLNINGGLFSAACDIVSGGGTSALNLNGGTLDLLGHNLGGTVSLTTLGLQNGTIQNVGQYNNGSGLVISASGTVTFAGTNNYTGSTTVNAGTVRVDGLIAGSGVVVNGGTLAGSGLITSSVSIGASGVLSPGDSAIGTLVISNTLALAGTNIMEINKSGVVITNDRVTGVSALTYGGTLQITATGSALAAGDSIKLFSAGSYSGSFTGILPATPGNNLAWDTTGLSNGVLAVKTAVVPQPKIISVNLTSFTNLFLFATNGSGSGQFYVLAATNLATPLSSWVPVSTNNFDSFGNFSNVVPLNRVAPQEFFLIKQ